LRKQPKAFTVGVFLSNLFFVLELNLDGKDWNKHILKSWRGKNKRIMPQAGGMNQHQNGFGRLSVDYFEYPSHKLSHRCFHFLINRAWGVDGRPPAGTWESSR
jgi:hypothetical protein